MDALKWLILVLGFLVFFFGGIVIGFLVGEGKMKRIQKIGYLVVDPRDDENHGGVYLQVAEDPKGLHDGEAVMLIVSKVSPLTRRP